MSSRFVFVEEDRDVHQEETAQAKSDVVPRTIAVVLCIIASVLVLALMIQIIVYFVEASNDGHGVDDCRDTPAQGRLTATDDGAGKELMNLSSRKDIDDVVAKSDAVVMFHASWCGVCTVVMPHVKSLALKSSIPVLAIESAKVGAKAMKELGVTGFPTFIKFEKGTGKVLGVIRGGNIPALKKMLDDSVSA